MSTNAINSFFAQRKDETDPNKPGGGDKKFMSKDEKKKKYFAPKAEEEVFRVIVPAVTGKHYEEAYFHDVSTNGGPPQQFYCLNHNDSKPCPLCEKRESLKQQAWAEEKGSDEQKSFLKASNVYEPRLYYMFKGLSRGHLSDGLKFWRIKKNFKNMGAMNLIEAEAKTWAKRNTVDFADPISGADLEITTVEQAKTSGPGTYRAIQTIRFSPATPLHTDEAEVAKLVNDPMTWKDIFTPIAINGHLDEYQFLQAVVEGRAPEWDKQQSKWILTNGETGEKYVAVLKRDENAPATTPEAEAETPAPTAEAPATTVAKKAPVKKSVVMDDDNDLPF